MRIPTSQLFYKYQNWLKVVPLNNFIRDFLSKNPTITLKNNDFVSNFFESSWSYIKQKIT